MNENEKLVWAATYAAEYVSMHEKYCSLGIEPHILTAVEAAWGAVSDMRDAKEAYIEGWGEDCESTKMLLEMIEK